MKKANKMKKIYFLIAKKLTKLNDRLPYQDETSILIRLEIFFIRLSEKK